MSEEKTDRGPTSEADRGLTAWMYLAVAFGLAISNYYYGYRPVLDSRLASERGDAYLALGRVDQAQAAYQAASQADPWSPLPWQNLALLELQTADQSQGEERFQMLLDQSTRRAPQAWGTWFQVGNGWLSLYRRTGRDAYLADALHAYEQARDRYPNYAYLWAQIAWVYSLQGDEPAARSAAERALMLDDAHQHSDRKLAKRRLVDTKWDKLVTPHPLPDQNARQIMMQLLQNPSKQN